MDIWFAACIVGRVVCTCTNVAQTDVSVLCAVLSLYLDARPPIRHHCNLTDGVDSLLALGGTGQIRVCGPDGYRRAFSTITGYALCGAGAWTEYSYIFDSQASTSPECSEWLQGRPAFGAGRALMMKVEFL